MADPTIHVAVAFDSDTDQPYVYEAMEGDTEDRYDAFEGDVPEQWWIDLRAHEAGISGLVDAVAERIGFDTEMGRLLTRCDAWHGDESPGHTWWQINLAASDSEHEWPVRDAVMGHHRDLLVAEQTLADLPDEFWMTSGHQLVRIERSRLTITRHGYGPNTTACYRCGWSKDEHDA